MRAALLLAVLASPPAFSHTGKADEPPAFRKGMWEHHRTVPGQGAGGKDAEIVSKKCLDPTASFKTMGEMLAKQGCRSGPAAVKGNVRTSTSECPVHGGVVTSERVMIITSDSAYTVNITTTSGGKTSKETLVAKRLGDC